MQIDSTHHHLLLLLSISSGGGLGWKRGSLLIRGDAIESLDRNLIAGATKFPFYAWHLFFVSLCVFSLLVYSP